MIPSPARQLDLGSAVLRCAEPRRPRRIGGAAGRYAFYTPPLLAAWVAAELARHVRTKRPTVLDPACGDGVLLEAFAAATGGRARLAGIDLDPHAIAAARRRLGPRTRFLVRDALRPPGEDPVSALRSALGLTPDALIANPPWGASLGRTPEELRAAGFSLAAGQFDSYELFVELFLRIGRTGATAGFILPDSLFLPEHEPVRRLLLASTTLHLLARLGEGFFPGVYRGAVVVVASKGKPPPGAAVECFRLRPDDRRRVLAGEVTLGDLRARHAHLVPQARFAADGSARFDLDLREDEAPAITALERVPHAWSRWVDIGRGVEVSKQGRVTVCEACGRGAPAPRAPGVEHVCVRCRARRPWREGLVQEIVRARGAAGVGEEAEAAWRPLIVGEDVDRYRCAPSREIRLGMPGIAYKDPVDFARRKLLVRKTGVGLKAAIDGSGAHTVQVVFQITLRPDAPPFLLEYLQGVLSSRVLLAYHLRRGGESEWRSHPYITPRVLCALPIPEVEPGTWPWRQAQAIAEAVVRRRPGVAPDDPSDLAVEARVAGLYGLRDADCTWVTGVLDEAQGLEPIATLRLPSGRPIRPVRVD